MKPISRISPIVLFIALPLVAQEDSGSFVPGHGSSISGVNAPPTKQDMSQTAVSPDSMLLDTPSIAIQAKELPEMELRTRSVLFPKVKIFSIIGDSIKILEHPYWDVKPIAIAIDDITSLRKDGQTSRGGRVLTGMTGGFAIGFLTVGIAGGLSSKYNTDYQATLIWSVAIGAVGGIVGSLVGMFIPDSHSQQLLWSKKKEENIKVLMHIMGLDAEKGETAKGKL
jgi:hypothetical protein